MRFPGITPLLLAAGLVFAGLAHAAPQAPSAAAAAASTTAPAAAKPTDPMLAMDGAPAMLPTAGIGDAVDGGYDIQPQVTKNGQFAKWMHNSILVPLITIICLFVLALLIWVVIRYRAAANPVASKTSHNTVIEVIWTLLPVLILVAIAVPSIGLLQAQFKPAPNNAITLKAIGNQWYWSYQYPDNGGFEITANLLKESGQGAAGERTRTPADGPRLLATDNRVVLPVGVPIRLITTSNDVIHSWAVPAFWIKLDAVPGRLNETSFTIEKPGLYFGQCSELCGARHAYMPIAVEAVPLAVYNRWVVAKGGTVASAAKPSTATPAQPGADLTENGVAANTAGPAENATVTPATSAQPATGNPAGAGNPGN
ncbi:cytochrome c oxidase subunit II [uncultured Sphingomonas sp.]|uniref:cytochrome c oxidase subunit II n=1 Tax=uncultured Sphingomonas sp. TaxID=158754 RepID=UPI0035CC1B73